MAAAGPYRAVSTDRFGAGPVVYFPNPQNAPDYVRHMLAKNFKLGDRVTVSASGGWKRSFEGAIVGGPESTTTMQGPEDYYWVQFDENRQCVDGDDEYYKAQILSRYLALVRPVQGRDRVPARTCLSPTAAIG